MVDIWSRRKRSEVMSRIRSSGNRSTELRLVALFRAQRFTGWRRGQPLPGRPDFVFRRHRLCVFVDGCFWHGCPRHGTAPKANAAFWRIKIDTNRTRDRRVTRELRAAGWRVLRVWEHELRVKNQPRLLLRMQRAFAG